VYFGNISLSVEPFCYFVCRYCQTRLCPVGYFRCGNGQCVQMSKKCDRSDDCGDRSDEADCPCNPHSEFQCVAGNRTCIKAVYRCDQEKDCPDASDEMGCPEMGCRNLLRDSTSATEQVRVGFSVASRLGETSTVRQKSA